MKEFTNSIFWKFIAIAFVISIFYLGWSISHQCPDIMSTPAQAQVQLRTLESGEYILTTNREGNVIYAYGFEKTATNAPPKLKDSYKFEAR